MKAADAINGTKSTPGPWEYYRETMPGGDGVTISFESVRQKGGKNIVRLHNAADAQLIALAPEAIRAIAIALGELEAIRTEKLAVRYMADYANAISRARLTLGAVIRVQEGTIHSANAEGTNGEWIGPSRPIGADPCPWCGESHQLLVVTTQWPRRPRRNVWCPCCDIKGPEHLDDAGAIEIWNATAQTRTPND